MPTSWARAKNSFPQILSQWYHWHLFSRTFRMHYWVLTSAPCNPSPQLGLRDSSAHISACPKSVLAAKAQFFHMHTTSACSPKCRSENRTITVQIKPLRGAERVGRIQVKYLGTCTTARNENKVSKQMRAISFSAKAQQCGREAL